MADTGTMTSAETDSPRQFTSRGLRSEEDRWAQPPASHYVIEVSGSVFTGQRISQAFQATTPDPDDLEFNMQRVLAGEASAAIGRYRPLTDVLRDLRDRFNA